MDQHTVTRWVDARSRSDLHDTDPATAVVAGGTWLYSAPQHGLRTLVDLTTAGWEPLVAAPAGLEIAATCTVTTLRGYAAERPQDWLALDLVGPCCAAFAASPKVLDVATVGGNVCTALPAGPMISLLSALDATALVWLPDGTDRNVPVEDLVAGPGVCTLRPGEVLRSLFVPAHALHATTAFGRVALTAEGRSGAVVIARLDEDGTTVVSVTAATERPRRVAFRSIPSPAALEAAVDALGGWHEDHHGSAGWRRAMVHRLAWQTVSELRFR